MPQSQIPSKLYKYRTFDAYLLRILTHADLYYSDPATFNDPLDCNPTIEIDLHRADLENLCFSFLKKRMPPQSAREVISEFRHLSSEYGDFRSDPDAESYLNSLLARRIKESLHSCFGHHGVLSLTQSWNSMLMWSHYADHHRGMCIEFDTTELPHPNLRAVNYNASRSIKASVLRAWQASESEHSEAAIRDVFFLTKASPWRYEREWRAISNKIGVVESRFRVTGVYFGLRCDPAIIQAVVSLVANEGGINFYTIRPKKDGFSLDKDLIDTSEFLSMGLRTPPAIEFKDTW